MTSIKKYGIQEFTTKLPDFLLQFVDANIRNDTYGALRQTHLTHKIDDLIPQHLQSQSLIWLFSDPLGAHHIIIKSELFSHLSKASEALPKKDKQLLKTTRQIYQTLQYDPKNILSSMLKQDELTYVSKIKIISIDEIRLKCEANLYFEPEQIIKDITNVIAWSQVYRASSKRSFIHLSNFYGKFIELITKRKFISKFYEKKNKDFQQLGKLQQQFKLSVTSWPYIPNSFREYEHLENYLPTPNSRKTIIEEKLKSQKVPVQCPENCVCYRQNLAGNQEFCKYSLADVWQSQCPNRRSKIQCSHLKQQNSNKCRNSQIKSKKRKKVKSINDDKNCQIQQFMAWGIDLFTRNVIFNCLPELDIGQFCQGQKNINNKNNFIESTLQRALNFIGEKGFDLNEACAFIIEKGPTIASEKTFESKKNSWKSKYFTKAYNISGENLFTILDVNYAKNLMKNKLYADLQFPENQFFRIHTKGKGAKCIAKEGIKQGTFIVEYFGEIYEPWRWYEREDFIKEVLKKKKLKEVIPEFYNIYLQKHKDQPLGYDILVVDPIKKGNFSSRFSHSCTPNCGTVSTVSDGQYIIGMYSIKDIEYGEEFTFDYCSMTESSYEHMHSICLCGTKQCRGNYLQLANNKMYNNLMDANSCFHYRNSLMLKSLGPVTQKELQICHNANIKSGMLKFLPDWIIKWCSVILTCIQKQSEVYHTNLTSSWQKQYPWQSKSQTEEQKKAKIELYSEISKNDLIHLRFQNLITTIDKINYYLQSINDIDPPLHFESKDKICEVLIENSNKDSILILLQDECTNQKLKQQTLLIEDFLKKIKFHQNQLKMKEITSIEKDQVYNRMLFYFRLCCLCVSHQILCQSSNTANSNSPNRLLLSDIIYFYAFTHTYFTPHQYKTHTSEEIKVTLQQILGDNCNSKFSDKIKKRYTSPCVWGQLVSWFKQTIVNPEASLSQDRRGTLSYPLINSILKSNYPFEKHNRNSFLKTLRQKSASSWPPAQGCQLSYKNNYKCYGTMLFESVHNLQALKDLPKGNLLDSALDLINCSLSDKLKLFKEVEFHLQKIPQNSELYDVLEGLKLNLQQLPSSDVTQPQIKGAPSKKRKMQREFQSNEQSRQLQKQQKMGKQIRKRKYMNGSQEPQNKDNGNV